MPTNRYLERYGMTVDNWEALWNYQNGLCIICEKRFGKKRLACVDHDHKTGNVRGLLCQNCNWTIGQIHENKRWLFNAREYLLYPPAKNVFAATKRHVDAPPER